jgi:anti-sigma regulatory factor (Ser/Thr protein kinase)
LSNKRLQEDVIFKRVQQEFLTSLKLPKETLTILEYAFSEMLNNAIEHSSATRIQVAFGRGKSNIYFRVADNGVGIFNNVMGKRRLKNELEAIQDIFKGKQTTMPATHSGQGIFFTSKTADYFTIISGSTEVDVVNTIPDMFIKPHRLRRGTEIGFSISLHTPTKLAAIFHEFSNEEYEFDRTKILVHLFTMDTSFVSRSQARRLLVGLEEFKKITLDFNKVSDVGQGFADEIFRVFKTRHPEIQILYVNTNPTVEFMIKRVQAEN